MAADVPTQESTGHGDIPRDAKLHESLKYSLLGPSLLKSGQDDVDQNEVR